MLQTVTRPPVSLMAACRYCPALTAFACLRCSVPMCADCVPSDYCPDCQPAPVAPALDWQTERYGYFADVAVVACARCEAPVANPDDAEPGDVFCPACTLPPSPACLYCGNPMFRGDADAAGTRHPHCSRFVTALDARQAAQRAVWKEDAIAA